MKKTELTSSLLLLLAACIWGLAFVAQRVGGALVQPFYFNGVRFLLGALSLLPLIAFLGRGKPKEEKTPFFRALPAGLAAGTVLFIASSLQQIGMEGTTAGKAGFITGLYVVLVPVLGVFLRRNTRAQTWISAALAAAGLYFISVTGGFTVAGGDLYEIAGAFFWAVHILLIDRLSQRLSAIHLNFFQCITCSLLSLAAGAAFETVTVRNLTAAAIPILYGGLFSVGVAYSLQIAGQKHAKPSHSAIILSMESVFAALGGFVILHENLGPRAYFGCFLMIAGMILSQLPGFSRQAKAEKGREKADQNPAEAALSETAASRDASKTE